MSEEGTAMDHTVIFHSRGVRPPRASDYARGLAATFNLRGSTRGEYDFAPSAVEADRRALSDDWAVVGGDLTGAISSYKP